MTNSAISWIKKELGIVEVDSSAWETSIIAWAHTFLSNITPVIKQAVDNAVLAAVTVPGTGAMKAAAALAAATAELVSQGVPVVENDLKAAIQISYNALPASVTSAPAAAAVEGAADAEVDTVAAKVEAEAPTAVAGANAGVAATTGATS